MTSRIINHHGNVEEVSCPSCGLVAALEAICASYPQNSNAHRIASQSIAKARHSSIMRDPSRPYVVRDETGEGGKVVAAFSSNDDLLVILAALRKARGEQQ